MIRLPSLRSALPAVMLLGAGCSLVSPEARVRNRLVSAGVSPAMAGCLAERLVRKLDRGELEQLDRAAKMPADHPGRMTIADLADRLRALDNPHIVHVVTRAGLGCAIAG